MSCINYIVYRMVKIIWLRQIFSQQKGWNNPLTKEKLNFQTHTHSYKTEQKNSILSKYSFCQSSIHMGYQFHLSKIQIMVTKIMIKSVQYVPDILPHNLHMNLFYLHQICFITVIWKMRKLELKHISLNLSIIQP